MSEPTPAEMLHQMEECKIEIHDKLKDQAKQLEDGDERMDAMHEMIKQLADATISIKTNTDEILGIYKSGKVFFKVWGWFGGMVWKGAKFITAVSAAFAVMYGLYLALRYGVPTDHIPKRPH